MTVEELDILIKASTKNLQSEINEAKKKIEELSKSAEKSSKSIGASFLKANVFTKLLSKGVNAVVKQMDEAITRLDTLNNFSNVMSNLGVSTEEAEASIKRLSDKLQGLPTTLNDAVTSVQRLTATNGNIKASTDMFLALNNAILSGGASTEMQKSALEQLTQAYAKGKPDMMEWRTALTSMPAQLKQVAIAMGYVDANQLGEALRSGKVSMNDFMRTIMKLNKEGGNGFKSFEEQALNSTNGVRTSMTNVKTAITRGLTEIMNAIGQSNIAGFFQGIARAINNVIPYITGFIKGIVLAVQTVTALFGGKSGVGKTVEKVSNSMSNLGSSASSTANDMDSATGSAKKLKKELNGLAGFDEMNVLKETDNSSSGGSSDSSAGGIGDLGTLDFSDWETSMDNLPTKADEVAEKVRQALSKITDNIDYSKLQTSFNNLLEAVKPFTQNIWNGLKWGYDNILVPLSTFVINTIIPDFLDILAGAFNVLNSAIEQVKPTLQLLWDNILKPMAEWTGGVIDSVLSGIANALNEIAQNEVAVTILESLAIAIGLVSGAIAIWNVVGAIGTAVTTALGVAVNVLMSPITLVVLAIAGLIAIVILCVKHWDEIKEAGAKAWEKIKEAWNNVKDWFNDTVVQPVKDFFTGLWTGIKERAELCWTLIKGVWLGVKNWFDTTVIQPVKNFFSNMWDGLKNGAVNTWNGIKNTFSTVATFFKNIFTDAWTKVKNVFSVGGKIFDGIKDGIVNAFKTIVNGIIGGINKVVSIPFNAINNVLSKMKSIDILGVKPFSWVHTFNVPQIPKLAVGTDRVLKDGLAVIHKGEQIVPAKVVEGGYSNNQETKQPVQLIVKLGEDTIFDKFIENIKSRNFETNGEVFVQ